jgi:beta-lactamase regulating signal transducer with metallopeptidase domain
MTNKLVWAVVVIIGIIALIGAVVFGWFISQFGSSMSGLSSVDAATAAQYGLEVNQVQQVANQINTILTISYFWLVMAIITSLYAIYSGINEFRKK